MSTFGHLPQLKLLYSCLYPNRVMRMLDGYSGQEFVLLSYDVRMAARSVAVRVCRIVFGRVRTDRLEAGRPPEEKGFIHRTGGVWSGQSVLGLSPQERWDLADPL